MMWTPGRAAIVTPTVNGGIQVNKLKKENKIHNMLKS